MKKIFAGVFVLLVCCSIIHRRVIKSIVTGSQMPKAPKWHVWITENKRKG